MKILYDIRNDSNRLLAVQQGIVNEKTTYRTKWGLYGTAEWFINLGADNLIETIKGKISDLYLSGHNDFPEFKVDDGSKEYSFQTMGNLDLCQVGENVEIKCVRAKYILPVGGSEETLTPLLITAL